MATTIGRTRPQEDLGDSQTRQGDEAQVSLSVNLMVICTFCPELNILDIIAKKKPQFSQHLGYNSNKKTSIFPTSWI
jgi:hypothetical protein